MIPAKPQSPEDLQRFLDSEIARCEVSSRKSVSPGRYSIAPRGTKQKLRVQQRTAGKVTSASPFHRRCSLALTR
jgi:hypothetical protein